MTEIDTGISADDRALVGEELKKLLADTYALYLQTQNFHWNVTGPHFRQLHLMFEEQYLWLDQLTQTLQIVSSLYALKTLDTLIDSTLCSAE